MGIGHLEERKDFVARRPGFSVHRTSREDVEIFRCAGELDMATAPVLRQSTGGCARDAVVDLANVTFMDSSGTAVLIHLWAKLADRGYRLRISRPQPNVRKVFELSGVSEVLGVED